VNLAHGGAMNHPRLSSIQLAIIALAALRNSEELLADARLLLRHGRAARAYSLAALALEEWAKHIITASAIQRTAASADYWPRFWKRFRDHSAKADLGTMLASDWGLSFTYTDERLQADIDLALRTKLLGFYVDWTEAGLSEPALAVTPEAASDLIEQIGVWIAMSTQLFDGVEPDQLARAKDIPSDWLERLLSGSSRPAEG
jgi:AbiV family abortive infection protein